MRKLNELVEFISGSPQFRIGEAIDEYASVFIIAKLKSTIILANLEERIK